MPLIATLAAALGLALVLGFIAARLKLPALVGYLVAGVLIGPYTPGFVGDAQIAQQLAEIGVMLLMFGVGLHFSIDDLLAVKGVALPGALVQMAAATAMGGGMALAWGWPLVPALVLGLALSVASTVVLLRALEARGLLDSGNGRIAVGWLVVEDLAMVLVLVMLPALARPGLGAAGDAWWPLARTLLAVGAFVALMLLAGRRLLPWLLWQVARTGSRELFTLAVIAVAIALAFGASALFGVSVALGAFFAGLVLRGSEPGQRAAEESLPFQDAFAVLFFVSVGMLFDPAVLMERPLEVLAVTGIVVLGKSLAAAALVLALGYPLATAITVSASLAQIGEFSFILVALGGSLGLLPPEATSLVVAAALLSIALNPALFALAEPARRWLASRSGLARRLDARTDRLAVLPDSMPPEELTGHVVLVGYGTVGRAVAAALTRERISVVVVERLRERARALRDEGLAAVSGDAADPAVLVQAHIHRARLLVVAASEASDLRPIIDAARTFDPALPILVRASDAEEAAWLEAESLASVVHPRGAVAEVLAAAAMRAWHGAPGAAPAARTAAPAKAVAAREA